MPNKNDEIEELSFDDAKIEIKIDSKNIKLENASSNVSNDDNSSLNGDVTDKTDNDDNKEETLDADQNSSNDSGNDMVDASDDDIDASDDIDTLDDVPDDNQNQNNDEEDINDTKDSGSSDENSPSLTDENRNNESSGDKESNEQKPDSNENNPSKNDKDKKDTDGSEKNNNDPKEDKKSDNGNENNKNNNQDQDKKNDSNQKEGNKPTDENKNNSPQNNDKKANDKPKNQDNKPNSNEKNGNKPDQNRKNLKDNKPKSPKDFANRAKNRIGNAARNKARNTLNNSNVGQAVDKAKDVAEKSQKVVNTTKNIIKFFKSPAGHAILIFLGVVFAIILVVSIISSFIPNLGGEVSNEENLSKYSEVDKKVIEKLKSYTEQYPNGDPAYAMVATIYPYEELLQGGNVKAIRNKTNEEYQDETDELNDENNDSNNTNNNDSSDESDYEDDENDLAQDDLYLELFRKWTYRHKFKTLLKESEKGEDAFTSFLKEKWFKKDSGYKEMFDGVEDYDELANAIIDDILGQKDDFDGYFFDLCTTTYNFDLAGQIQPDREDIKSMMSGNVLIDLLDAGCGSVNSCPSYYGSPISIDKYIKGVVYEELGSSNNIEQIKAQMVAAKSYTLSRHKPILTDDGTYVIKMRWSTADQDYCDYEKGCKNVKENYGYNNSNDCTNCKHWANREAASEEKIKLYDQAWEESKNIYVVDSDGTPRGSYREGCTKGTCMDQKELEKIDNMDYQSILQSFYTKYTLAVQEGEFATALTGTSSKVCANTNGNGFGISDDKFKFYYQEDYSDLFCGSDKTIAIAGCGGTSYAMLVANLSNDTNFNPVDASNEGKGTNYCGSSGTSDGLFTNTLISKHSGFTAKNIEVSSSGAQEVLQVIMNGGLVVANVQGQSPFTWGGHWIVIRAIDINGKVKVADPISKDRSLTGTYDINKFIDDNYLVDEKGNKHNWIAVYGPSSEEIKESNNTVVTGDGKTTGYLKSPLDPNHTNEEAIKAVKDNSKTLYYLSGSYHGGIDFPKPEGSNIYAMDGGEVVTSKWTLGGYGNYIIIKHTANDKTYYTLYGHLSERVVKKGDRVSQGQLIGLSGNTGNSSGPHLHAELINSIDCLGHTCEGVHYNVLDYIGTNKTYVGAKCTGQGC